MPKQSPNYGNSAGSGRMQGGSRFTESLGPRDQSIAIMSDFCQIFVRVIVTLGFRMKKELFSSHSLAGLPHC
jgi:hypothetical protein